MSRSVKADPMYCEHDRTRATCEECVHADALADPTRAPATREEMYPFPEGAAIRSDVEPEADDEAKAHPKRRRR